MGVDSPAYDVVLTAHILCAVVGFGAVALNGIYGVEAKRRGGAQGLAIFEATEKVARVAEAFILAVPVLGISLVLMSHQRWSFSQAWVVAALALFGAALVLVFGFHRPNLLRMRTLMGDLALGEGQGLIAAGAQGTGSHGTAGSEGSTASQGGVVVATALRRPPPQVAELERRGRRAAAYGATLNAALITMVVLMVWKPGS